MTGLLKREPKHLEKVEMFDWFGRMFDDWTRVLPFRRPTMLGREWTTEELIRVDEFARVRRPACRRVRVALRRKKTESKAPVVRPSYRSC